MTATTWEVPLRTTQLRARTPGLWVITQVVRVAAVNARPRGTMAPQSLEPAELSLCFWATQRNLAEIEWYYKYSLYNTLSPYLIQWLGWQPFLNSTEFLFSLHQCLLLSPICAHTHSILHVVIRDPVPMPGWSFHTLSQEVIKSENSCVPRSSCYYWVDNIYRTKMRVAHELQNPAMTFLLWTLMNVLLRYLHKDIN